VQGRRAASVPHPTAWTSIRPASRRRRGDRESLPHIPRLAVFTGEALQELEVALNLSITEPQWPRPHQRIASTPVAKKYREVRKILGAAGWERVRND
jgi:hypothetical protein